MLIVLGFYALLVWLVFFKFKLLPYNKLWKTVVWGGAITIGLVVVGALQHYTPTSSKSVVSAFSQKLYPQVSGRVEQVTFTLSPGKVYESEVLSMPMALTQGQLFADSGVDPMDAIAGAKNSYPIRHSFPKDADEYLRRPGGLVSVTVLTDEDNPINILAVILQWIGAWVSYVF